MSRWLFTAAALALAAPAAGARPLAEPETPAGRVAPYLDGRTVLVVHVEAGRVDPADVAAAFAAVTGIDPKAVAPPGRPLLPALPGFLKAGGTDLFLVFSLADLADGPFVIAPAAPGADPKDLARALAGAYSAPGYGSAALDQAAFLGPISALKRLRDLKPTPFPELATAFDALGDAPARAVLLAGPDTRRPLEELLPTLPPEFGGVPLARVARDVRWFGMAVNVKPVLVRLTVQCRDRDSAREVKASLDAFLAALAKRPDFRSRPRDFARLAGLLDLEVRDTRLSRSLDEKQLAAALRPVAAVVRESSKQSTSTNNLKQIGLALHNYHDVHGRFPAAASYGRRQEPLLSWRVHLLPFLDQGELYKQFHLDEPWNSEHNSQLIARMPAVYASSPDPKVTAAGKTTYLAPRGDTTMFPGMQGVRIVDVTDGLSQTIFVVDADDAYAVPWTQPDDLPYNPKEPFAGLGFRYDDGCLVLLGDGAVYRLRKTVPKETLQALFTRNGGEVVTLP